MKQTEQYTSMLNVSSDSTEASYEEHPSFIHELSDETLVQVHGGCLVEHYPTLFGIPLTFLGYSTPCGCAYAAPGQAACM